MSATLTDPAWNNTTVLAGPVVDGVRALKERSSGPILVAGSATLVHTLLDAGLVDELRLMVFPVSIGGGVRVFPDLAPAHRLDRGRLALVRHRRARRRPAPDLS